MSDDNRGIRCPYCGSETHVIRTAQHTNRTVRRRGCNAGCSDRIVSEERIVTHTRPDVISGALVRLAVAELLERLEIDACDIGSALIRGDNGGTTHHNHVQEHSR